MQMMGIIFQRVQVPYRRELRSELLVSRKVACRKVCTEGSETTKVGTDEQKLDMRHDKSDKVAHHTNVQT